MDSSEAATRPDADLVLLAKNGDAGAFTNLVERTRPRCMRAARSILGDVAEAEDRVQDAYLKAWRNLPLFREDASFSTWILRIVTNECLMAMRRRKRVFHYSLDEPLAGDSPQAVMLPDERPNPEQQLGSGELTGLLENELRRIPPIFRKILTLTEVQGLELPEIAIELGITAAAAKSRLHRARRALRERILQRHSGRMGLGTLVVRV